MKHFKTLCIALGIFSLSTLIFSFKNAEEPIQTYDYKMLTAVESVADGYGRSRLMTNTDSYNEKDLKGVFSPLGISFKNISSNDNTIVQELTKLSAQGWELVSVNTLEHSRSQTDDYNSRSIAGLMMTRYLLRKAK